MFHGEARELFWYRSSVADGTFVSSIYVQINTQINRVHINTKRFWDHWSEKLQSVVVLPRCVRVREKVAKQMNSTSWKRGTTLHLHDGLEIGWVLRCWREDEDTNSTKSSILFQLITLSEVLHKKAKIGDNVIWHYHAFVVANREHSFGLFAKASISHWGLSKRDKSHVIQPVEFFSTEVMTT